MMAWVELNTNTDKDMIGYMASCFASTLVVSVYSLQTYNTNDIDSNSTDHIIWVIHSRHKMNFSLLSLLMTNAFLDPSGIT